MDLGTSAVRLHPRQLPHLPAKQPKRRIGTSLPSAFQLLLPAPFQGLLNCFIQRRTASFGKKSCVSVPRSPSLQLSHGMTAKTSTCRGKLHELSLLQVEERYLPDCYSVQCFKCVLFSHCGMFLLWMFATSSQKFQ